MGSSEARRRTFLDPPAAGSFGDGTERLSFCREQQDGTSVLRVQKDAAWQTCQTGIWPLLNWKDLLVRPCLSPQRSHVSEEAGCRKRTLSFIDFTF